MYEAYEKLPFGMLFLGGNPLVVEYVNSKFLSLVASAKVDLLNEFIFNIQFLKKYEAIFMKCLEDNREISLKKEELFPNTYFDIFINPQEDGIQVFIYPIIFNASAEKNNFSIQAMIDVLPYCVYITNTLGEIIYTNQVGSTTFPNFFCKHKINTAYDFYSTCSLKKEDGCGLGEEETPLYLALKKGKETKNLVLKFLVNSVELYIDVSVFPIYDSGEIIGSITSCEEITEKYLQREKIRRERKKFLSISTELKSKCDIIQILRNREKEHLMHLKDVINNISEGIIILDRVGKFSFCNKAAYEITELTPNELMEFPNFEKKYNIFKMEHFKTYSAFYPKDYSVKEKPIKNLVLKLEYKESGKSKYIEVNSNFISNKIEKSAYTILTIKDITEMKIHEINAEEQAAFVKSVVDTIEVPIAVIQYPGFKYKLVNKKYEQIVEQVTGEKFNIAQNNSNAERLLDFTEKINSGILHSAIKKQEYTYSPYCIKNEEGKDRFYKIKFAPYANGIEEVTDIYLHGLDITEEINHNRELEKVTKLKDEFFAIISHELRTPLTIIYSSLQLAYDVYGKEITSNIDKTLGRIHQNCSRLLKLINNILDLSKAEAGFLSVNTSVFDIVELTEFIVCSVNLYASSKNINLIFDTNEEEARISLDKDKYEKIVLNLLSNSIKFTPEGKQILVEIRIVHNFVELVVKDEGIGIPRNKLNYIFDRFAQVNSSLSRRAEGTGLGLALVKKLVELMNGEIEVKSTLKAGTEFIVRFEKICGEIGELENQSIIDENMNDKVNIEFSDIN